MNRSLGINSHYEFYTTSIYIVGDVLIFFFCKLLIFQKKVDIFVARLLNKKMIKLGNIATIQTGVYLKSSPSPDTCYLQVNDFDEEGNIRSTVRPTTTINHKAAHHLLTANDLLLAAKGGKNFCTIAPTQFGPCVASPSFLIIRINDPSRVLPEYLCGFLNLPSTRQLLTAQAQGSAITSLSKADLEEFEIPLPPLERQQACIALTRLHHREQALYKAIAERRRQITDYKLTKIYKDER